MTFNLILANKKVYAEIFQSSTTKFSFVDQEDNNLLEMFSPVACRDFLNDVVYTELTKGKGFSIYGFTSPPAGTIPLAYTQLLVHGSSQELDNIQNRINSIEVLNTTNTTVVRVNENVSYVCSDNVWLKAPWGISLFTYLIRCLGYTAWKGDFKDLSGLGGNEHGYANSIGYERFTKLLDNAVTLLNTPVPESIDPTGLKPDPEKGLSYPLPSHVIHNYSGIVSVFKPTSTNFYAETLNAL